MFDYDFRSLIAHNWEWMLGEITRCEKLNTLAVESLLPRLKRRMNGSGWGAEAAGMLIYKTFLVASWLNMHDLSPEH